MKANHIDAIDDALDRTEPLIAPEASIPPGRRFSSPWFVLFLLVLSVIISFIDRQVVGVLIDPIRADLNLTDFQISLVAGPAFFILYFLGGLAGGWAVDRFDRPLVIGIATAAWSVMTALCGLAGNFWQIALARMGVGSAEGTLGPGVHSLIADSFDKKRLPMAMSIYSAASAIGSGVSLLAGGLILQAFMQRQNVLPFIGHLHPWQLTFMMVSLPGLILAPLLIFTLKIPPRPVLPDYGRTGVFREINAFWKERRLLVILFILGIGTLNGAELSFILWMPTLLMRVHGMAPGVVGKTMGTMVMVLGASGSIFWGFVATAIARRGREDAAMMTMISAVAIFVCIIVLPPLMPTGTWVLITLAPCLIFARSFIGLAHAAVQLVTPQMLRGRVSALYNGTATLLGIVVGPTGIGALTTYVFADDQKLGYAIAIMTFSMSLIGFCCLIGCIKPYRRALALVAPQQMRSDQQIEDNRQMREGDA